MTQRLSRGCLGSFLMACWVCMMLPATSRAAATDLHLSPASVSIGSFFQGADLQVAAEIPAGAAAVIEIRGPEREEHLARKGRRWGLWMNTGELTIGQVPSLYLVAATEPALAAAPDAPWGYPVLEHHARIRGEVHPEGRAFFFKQFIALKESEGMYLCLPDQVTQEPGPEGSHRCTAVFRLPARVLPGVYQVSLGVIKDGRKILEKHQELPIVKVGLPALVSNLAYEQSVLYGLAAVLIALIAGFLMGFFFKGKGAH